MPYIEQTRRDVIDSGMEVLEDEMKRLGWQAGDLNYAITKLALRFIQRHGMSYATLNAVAGVLACAQMELYRRLTARYEDLKITTNGDVYPAEDIQ